MGEGERSAAVPKQDQQRRQEAAVAAVAPQVNLGRANSGLQRGRALSRLDPSLVSAAVAVQRQSVSLLLRRRCRPLVQLLLQMAGWTMKRSISQSRPAQSGRSQLPALLHPSAQQVCQLRRVTHTRSSHPMPLCPAPTWFQFISRRKWSSRSCAAKTSARSAAARASASPRARTPLAASDLSRPASRAASSSRWPSEASSWVLADRAPCRWARKASNS